jgi:hypothetical protein
MTWVHEEASSGVEYHGLMALCFIIRSPSLEFRFEHFFSPGFLWENSRLGFNAFHVILTVSRIVMLVPPVRIHSVVTVSIKEICCLVGTQFFIYLRCSGGKFYCRYSNKIMLVLKLRVGIDSTKPQTCPYSSFQVYHSHTWRHLVLYLIRAKVNILRWH